MEKFKDFAKEHPFLTYFITRGVVHSVCRGVVDIVRAITGNYPPATPVNVYPSGKKEEETEIPFEDVADKETWTDKDFN